MATPLTLDALYNYNIDQLNGMTEAQVDEICALIEDSYPDYDPPKKLMELHDACCDWFAKNTDRYKWMKKLICR